MEAEVFLLAVVLNYLLYIIPVTNFIVCIFVSFNHMFVFVNSRHQLVIMNMVKQLVTTRYLQS